MATKISIETLTITNLGGISGTVSYVLGNGMFALVSANGTGKSTAVNALRFALTGKVTSEFIHAGCTKGSVEITLSDGARIRRVVTATVSGGVTVRQSVNGKESSKALAAEVLYGTDAENAVLVSSGDFENDPDGPAGKILMSYMDASVAREDVLTLILSDDTPDDVYRAAEETDLPGSIYMDDTKTLAAEYLERRKAAKRNRKALEASLDPSGSKPGDVRQLEKELESARNAEAKAMAASQLMESWLKRNRQREKALAGLGQIRAEIRKKEEDLASKKEGTRPLEEIDAALTDNAAKQAAAKAQLESLSGEVRRLTELVERLKAGICPMLSSGSNSVKCMADLSPVIESVKADGKAAVLKKREVVLRLDALAKEHASLLCESKKAQAVRDGQKELSILSEKEKALAAGIPAEEPKPEAVDVNTAKQARMLAEKALEQAKAAERNAKVKGQIAATELEEKVADLFVKGFDPSGPVCTKILSGYTDTLTQAAKESGEICGIYVRFSQASSGGLAAEFMPGAGGKYRSYAQLSGGERVLACITMTDILSRVCGNSVLVVDNLERMDAVNLAKAAELVSRIAGSYGTVLMAAADHAGTADILDGCGIRRITPDLGVRPITDIVSGKEDDPAAETFGLDGAGDDDSAVGTGYYSKPTTVEEK